jgi:hypothetical protein
VVNRCAQGYTGVHSTGVHRGTQGYTGIHGGTQEYTGVHRGTKGHAGLQYAYPGSEGTRGTHYTVVHRGYKKVHRTGVQRDTQGYTGVHGGTQGYTGVHRGTQGHTGVCIHRGAAKRTGRNPCASPLGHRACASPSALCVGWLHVVPQR